MRKKRKRRGDKRREGQCRKRREKRTREVKRNEGPVREGKEKIRQTFF